MNKLIPLVFLLLSFAFANEYEWRDVVQRVDIQPNGDVIVTDERTLWTDEDFGEAFICVELEDNQTLTLLEWGTRARSCREASLPHQRRAGEVSLQARKYG
jgi:hypothetical protein